MLGAKTPGMAQSRIPSQSIECFVGSLDDTSGRLRIVLRDKLPDLIQFLLDAVSKNLLTREGDL